MYNWIEAGCARDRLNIGIPGYGRAFSADGRDPLKAFGQSGGGSGAVSSPYLGESGLLAYFEVRAIVRASPNEASENKELFRYARKN